MCSKGGATTKALRSRCSIGGEDDGGTRGEGWRGRGGGDGLPQRSNDVKDAMNESFGVSSSTLLGSGIFNTFAWSRDRHRHVGDRSRPSL